MGGIVVVNHARYLDGLVLCAALPGELVFVAKKELATQFFAGIFLRRLGMLFVERADPEASIEDAEAALAVAHEGRRLLFFAEGTLTRVPGLLDFRLGAFVTAVRAGLPVVPVTLLGTRSVLRGDQWFPRRDAVGIVVDQPISPDRDGFEAAVRLRDAARARILERCGEPDLAQERAHLMAEREKAQKSGG
jgi:1-acyl-sn-glycerol-3-phosphate acyltransferase